MSELIKIMKFITLFTKINIQFSISTNNVEGWVNVLNQIITESLTEGIGLIYYLADIYIEQIKGFSFIQISELINPFVKLFKTIQIPQIIEMIYFRVFLRIKNLEHAEFAD